MNKKVSSFWQCGMVIIVPLGLWAFYRIKKLRFGLLAYIVSITIPLIIYIIHGVYSYQGQESESTVAYLLYIVSWFAGLIIMMILMNKWTNKWNETASDVDIESRDKNLRSSYPDRYSKDEDTEYKKD